MWLKSSFCEKNLDFDLSPVFWRMWNIRPCVICWSLISFNSDVGVREPEQVDCSHSCRKDTWRSMSMSPGLKLYLLQLEKPLIGAKTHTRTHPHTRAGRLHLPLAALLTKGQFKAKCSQQSLNKPQESPPVWSLSLSNTRIHTCTRMQTHTPSNRLTTVIEFPFASSSVLSWSWWFQDQFVRHHTHQQQLLCVW